MKKIIRILFSRITVIALLFVLEILFIFSAFTLLGDAYGWIDGILRLISFVFVLTTIRDSTHLSSDILYMLICLLFPVMGAIFLLFTVTSMLSNRLFYRVMKEEKKSEAYLIQDEAVLPEIRQKDKAAYLQARYLSDHCGYPAYRNSQFDYYKCGEEGYPVMLEELKKAKEYIFLEYFIIEKGKMWDGIHDILKQKAKEGVLVRVMYDDMGSLMTVKSDFAQSLEKEGIHCVSFNRLHPLVSVFMNHRDHRKIMVIDGKVAFSGGVNLADEYINAIVKHGYWKDNIIRIQGPAVWSYCVLFLKNWNGVTQEDKDYSIYRRSAEEDGEDGYIIPYGQTPLGNSNVGQNVYMNILNTAENYVYIYTPVNALILAAQRGVDVRLVTPGIPDKKIVWEVTRSYYNTLIRGGVKIYEYTPGFDHAKVFVSDDQYAAVGTLNLDYRSLYLHFENGTYLYGSKEIAKIRADLEEAFTKSHLVSEKESRTGFFRSLFRSFLRIIAPQM